MTSGSTPNSLAASSASERLLWSPASAAASIADSKSRRSALCRANAACQSNGTAGNGEWRVAAQRAVARWRNMLRHGAARLRS